MIRFDPTEHAYYLEDRRLPNVTSILEPLCEYAGVPKSILDAAALRGQHVHEACEMYLWGTLDEESLDDDYKPYLDAFKLFLSETNFVPEHTEERVYHKTLMYAGTMDLGGILPGRAPKRALIDIKTTFKLMATVGPQTAAYQEAWNSTHDKPEQYPHRYGLQLKKDGKYKLLPYTNTADMNVFRSCLVVHNFMRNQK